MSNSNGWDFSDYSSQSSGSGTGGGFGGFGDGSGAPAQNPFGGQQGAPQQGSPQNPFGGGQAAPAQAGSANPFAAPGAPGPANPFSAGGPGNAGANPFGGSPQAPGTDLFGTAGALGGAPTRLESVSAPTGWLFAAVGLALVSGIVASIFGGIPVVAIVCWALAGPVVIGLLAIYLMKDVGARAHLTYSPPTWGPLLYAVGLGLTFIAVIIASLQIAFWVGRM